MAIRPAYYVTCDKCGDPAPVSTTDEEIAREYARQIGYFCERGIGDYCSAHRPT